ncbi:MAG: beta-galactosidase GalB [Opitutaceae bacterium]|jgi:beta-galactosidase
MRTPSFLVCAPVRPLFALIALACLARAADSPRERISIDSGWRFSKAGFVAAEGAFGDPALQGAVLGTRDSFLERSDSMGAGERPAPDGGPRSRPDFDDSGWRSVDLPHDWGVEGPFKAEYSGDTGRLPFWGSAWYRRRLDIPASDAGRRVFLDVDGAMSYATVWLNGHFVGGWPYGYASFELELTPYVVPGGLNVLAIRLDNPPNSSRWYPGGGIYRNVWLEKTSPIHVAHWGTTVTTPEVSSGSAAVRVAATLENDSDSEAQVTVRTEVFELGADGKREGGAVAASDTSSAKIPAHGKISTEGLVRVPNPRLWSTHSPNRYLAVTRVSGRDGETDAYETPFGIRTLVFDPSKGFLLNGERLKFQGVCDHHDLGSLGTAVNERAIERQLELLREMGCNAIRTSHNPPAPELLDACDRMGLVVMDEAFDCWARQKRPNDYHRLFADWHEADLRAQIRRDRNHPSVILWSIGNEIPEAGSPAGVTIATELARIAHEEDPTRPVTSACNNAQSGYNGFEDAVDVFGYNYRFAEYPKFHAAHPEKFLYGSETASTVSSRGVYVFPVLEDKSKGLTADFQVSSYDLYAPRWAYPPDAEFRAEDQDSYVNGEFVWTGWDYLGEPTPFGGPKDPARSSYFGIIDLAGFKKDRFYEYQAHWRPDLPMAHLLPHWTWPDRVGQVTPVFVYTSGDEAELFLNGKSLGKLAKGPYDYVLRWNDVVYQPGELRVVAYKGGKHWAEDSEKTAGPAAKLVLKGDRTEVTADGRDLVFVTASVCDKDGVLVPQAMNHIRFAVSGSGAIAATDNGDATSFESFQASERNAFNGLALAVVRAGKGPSGTIAITAESDGISGATLTVMAGAAE